jgi:hypothetical protein
MDRVVTDNLMAIAGAYRRATGKSFNQISKEFYGRGDFLEKFRRGEHSISVARLSEMMTKFRREWPKGEPWPYTRPVFMTRTPSR